MYSPALLKKFSGSAIAMALRGKKFGLSTSLPRLEFSYGMLAPIFSLHKTT